MIIQDTFAKWEGPADLRQGILTVQEQSIPPDQAWFLRIVRATLEERQKLIDAGYVLKDAGAPKFCRVFC